MYFLYTLLLFFFAILTLLFSPKKRLPSLAERLGFFNPKNLKKPIWIHAVSAGEVLSVKTLIATLKQQFPDQSILLSTITATGQLVAKRCGAPIDALIYFPFDFKGSVTRALARVDPKMVVITETEIWPHFLRLCHQKQIPVLWINGRISDQSYPRYLLIRWFLKKLFCHYTVIAMQSDLDCQRVISLGADPKTVSSIGNLKYDIDLLKNSLSEPLKNNLSASPLLIAASTMPLEEKLILETFRQLQAEHPTLRLLIAPRHPERFNEVAQLIEKTGFTYTRRSRLESEGKIILLDSLGELAATFQFATVVFMGGSLIPHGGHNILEPAFFSKPIIFGPYMENFRDISALFIENKAAIQVQSADQLAETINSILTNAPLAEILGKNARAIIDRNRGATEKVIALIRGLN